MKNFLLKFLRALSRRYAQITFKTLVSQNQAEDRKKDYLFGLYSLKACRYYSFLLQSRLEAYQKQAQYKPFIAMDNGLHEISEFL